MKENLTELEEIYLKKYGQVGLAAIKRAINRKKPLEKDEYIAELRKIPGISPEYLVHVAMDWHNTLQDRKS